MSHSDDLLRAFRIAVEDLEENRAGRLGVAQRRNLLHSGNWNVAAALFLGFLLCATIYGFAKKPLAPIQWILAIALFAALLAMAIWYFRRTRVAVAEGRVECLAGQVQVGSRGRQGAYLAVAGEVLPLPISLRNIRQGGVYRVYIVPYTRGIVGMEPIESISP
ncbi:hypothetical protein V2H45_15335 [Tumidithrix elongata RA019]|uniref:DUF304 domain-containing protein n=1 Tax=Tumidithrix elongata BACA0141 TaxID=2716417 RepID=A0AAW9PYJ6_9CYAN|nr:hypothetical protein [Tumidithrix elongata RA019]